MLLFAPRLDPSWSTPTTKRPGTSLGCPSSREAVYCWRKQPQLDWRRPGRWSCGLRVQTAKGFCGVDCPILETNLCRNEAKKRASLAEAAEAMEQTASRKEAPRTVKGTPYKGTSRWSKLLKVSTLQRSIQIWSFAFFFAIRYFLSTRKFTYGKKVGLPVIRAIISTVCQSGRPGHFTTFLRSLEHRFKLKGVHPRGQKGLSILRLGTSEADDLLSRSKFTSRTSFCGA